MRLLWITAALAFALDQLSKVLVFQVLALESRGQIDVFPPLLVFRPGLNTGINFGLFADAGEWTRWVLIGLAIAVSIFIVFWGWRSFRRPIEFIAGGMAIGGALGNALDRFIHPGVLDFLNMSCCGIQNPFVFNIADVFIFAGVFGLAFFTGPSGNTRARRKKGA